MHVGGKSNRWPRPARKARGKVVWRLSPWRHSVCKVSSHRAPASPSVPSNEEGALLPRTGSNQSAVARGGPAQSFGETGNTEGPSFLKPSSAWRYFVAHARGCSALLPRLGEEGDTLALGRRTHASSLILLQSLLYLERSGRYSFEDGREASVLFVFHVALVGRGRFSFPSLILCIRPGLSTLHARVGGFVPGLASTTRYQKPTIRRDVFFI